MNLTITQDNLYLLLPGKVARMAVMLSDDEHVSPVEAVRQIYNSPTYARLEQEETKMWHLGPVALYEDMTMPAIRQIPSHDV